MKPVGTSDNGAGDFEHHASSQPEQSPTPGAIRSIPDRVESPFRHTACSLPNQRISQVQPVSFFGLWAGLAKPTRDLQTQQYEFPGEKT